MKGVIHSIVPGVQVVDLSHEIPAHDVWEGALFLAGAAPYFPKGTIHCVVVDPGVGTTRLPVIVSAGGHHFVGPDNGLLSFLLKRWSIEEARQITNTAFMLDRISATFHGRDIFAPAAAYLARGAPIHEAGDRLNTLCLLEVPEPAIDLSGRLCGVVVHVDRFGNAVTNIHRSDLGEARVTAIRFGVETLDGLKETYGNVDPGRPVALFGSSDYLEIAVHRGSAAERYDLHRGTRVEVIADAAA
jgi:hypothetical protein